MKKAILIVSFGTTYPETRQKNIAAITRQVRALYPDVLVAEAVSSTIVRNVMKKREHMDAKSPEEGLIKLKEQGATHVAVFPTHVIDGIENHRMKQAVEEYRLAFEQITVADALLTEPEDYTNVAKALWESLKEETGDATVLIVAQRISTILHAEQIVVLDQGKIVGIGNHKQLLKNCEVYKEIALSQLSKEELENE